MVTELDIYPLPNMLDFEAKAAGCTVFSKVDLRKGYHQIPVNSADIPKRAITTPFGLRNAASDRTVENVETALLLLMIF